MLCAIVERFRIPYFAISLLLLASIDCYGDEKNTDKILSIELFNSSQTSINSNSNLLSDKHVGMDYTDYEIDRISDLQSELSQGLPKDAEQAKQLVLQRFQSMDASISQRLENAAKGLVKAMRYGIDRTPAMVFEGQAVIYGVSDVDEALERYMRWREGSSR